jgi:ribosomal-protein-alanine N-acetyltransferase
MAAEFPAFTTARLKLDSLTAADAPALYALLRNPEVTRYLSIDALASEQEAADLLALHARECAEWDEMRWAMRRAHDGHLIGTISLNGGHSALRRAEVGYVVAREQWRQGYAREAIKAVLAYAFGPLQLNRVEALVYAENEPSRALLRSLGFVEEGYLREHAWEKGRFWDDVIYALLARDYAGVSA